MAEHMQGAAPGSNPGTDYERRELRLLPLGLIGLGLFIFIGIAPLIILAGFPRTAHDVYRRLTIHPPRPRLQTNPHADLETYLAKEHHLLDSYGWVDKAHGIARIPIAVAMRREARQGIAGFPTATATPGRAGTGGTEKPPITQAPPRAGRPP